MLELELRRYIRTKYKWQLCAVFTMISASPLFPEVVTTLGFKYVQLLFKLCLLPTIYILINMDSRETWKV
jgi:hypothetical protein